MARRAIFSSFFLLGSLRGKGVEKLWSLSSHGLLDGRVLFVLSATPPPRIREGKARDQLHFSFFSLKHIAIPDTTHWAVFYSLGLVWRGRRTTLLLYVSLFSPFHIFFLYIFIFFAQIKGSVEGRSNEVSQVQKGAVTGAQNLQHRRGHHVPEAGSQRVQADRPETTYCWRLRGASVCMLDCFFGGNRMDSFLSLSLSPLPSFLRRHFFQDKLSFDLVCVATKSSISSSSSNL